MARAYPPSEPDQIEATSQEVVLGVDTHKDRHVAAILTTVGMVLGTAAFPTTAAGYQQLLAWAHEHGTLRRAGVEGTGSYGAALARHLHIAGVTVLEINRPDRAARRRRGKTDTLDAEAAARAVLAGHATSTAKTGNGSVEMARMFRLARLWAVKARTQALNQLHAVLVCADTQVRESLAGLGRARLVRHCAALDPQDPTDPASAAIYTLRRLATRILTLTGEIDDLNRQLKTVLTRHAPDLLARPGPGPDTTAALLITAGDNPDRLVSDASFAALCGVSPVEASSGKIQRHRLNRGGDRQANAALHRIVITRLRYDPRTRAYQQRRLTEGKTPREIVRCLKRYVAREIYHALPTPPTAPAA
ncbi:transposase [Parafrankia colletiae]|uniref:Transposase n=1 Tax=Parafrankia colletiae TaxID=573497 RepID=A0A1S1RBW1_9ACTN|nr:IS110 family transposase [Parafrankia colletiae]MCK9904970.1 IS110 family transposase [Frankia sp. Cpl3]OHV44318.1 transposase [Parafrankia colletiae]